MTTESGAALFLAHAPSDELARVVLAQLHGEQYELYTSNTMTLAVPRVVALREAVSAARAAIAVLPRPGGRDRSSVIFEAGIAVGAGLPLLVVSEERKLPRDMQDLPFLPATALGRLATALDDAIRAPARPARARSPQTLAPATADDVTLHPVTRTTSPKPSRFPEKDLVVYVAHLFREHGAEVFITRGDIAESATGPDLVVWHNDLLSEFGLPLPVEMVRSTQPRGRLIARLRKVLDGSGARSLIAVAGSGNDNFRWSDGSRQMLTVTVESLEVALRAEPLPTALAKLLVEASS